MNKMQLAQSISDMLLVSIEESNDFIDAMQIVFTNELRNNGSILIQGFGVFTPWGQTERVGRNPKTGKTCIIKPRVSVKFKPGKRLLRDLNI